MATTRYLLVTDTGALTGSQSFTVVVANVNDAPAPTAPAINTNEDTAGTSQIAPNDPDSGDTHTYAVTTPAQRNCLRIDQWSGNLHAEPQLQRLGLGHRDCHRQRQPERTGHHPGDDCSGE